MQNRPPVFSAFLSFLLLACLFDADAQDVTEPSEPEQTENLKATTELENREISTQIEIKKTNRADQVAVQTENTGDDGSAGLVTEQTEQVDVLLDSEEPVDVVPQQQGSESSAANENLSAEENELEPAPHKSFSAIANADGVEEKTTGVDNGGNSMALNAQPDKNSSSISVEEEEFLSETKIQLEEQSEIVGSGILNNDASSDAGDNDGEMEAITILGKEIQPGKMRRLRWIASETFYGSKLDTPVYVIHGTKPGLTLCLTAAVHGDELNGVEIVRHLVNDISPEQLSGTIIGVPIVNLLGFTRGTRYLPDRRDLNRYFPGNPRGSAASRIAYSFFEEVIRNCDRLVDFHTGSLNRTNMPQLRANLEVPYILEFTQKFGSTAVLHSGKLRGNLRSAATNIGIPAVALELGEPGSLQKKQIKDGIRIIEVLLSKLNLLKRHRGRSEPQPVYYSSRWVRVNNGGLLTTEVKVGARIKKGTVLGTLVNPLSNDTFEVISPYNGRLLGMALNQFMLPGYAAFNIGLVEEEPEHIINAQTFECSGTGVDPDEVNAEFSCESDESEEIERVEDILSDDIEGEIEPEPH